MGQWSHRRRRGGGSTAINQIIQLLETTPFQAIATYLAPINAANFDLADFTSEPSGEQPDLIQQSGPSGLELNFIGDISADTHVDYDGSTPGVVTPQTKTYD